MKKLQLLPKYFLQQYLCELFLLKWRWLIPRAHSLMSLKKGSISHSTEREFKYASKFPPVWNKVLLIFDWMFFTFHICLITIEIDSSSIQTPRTRIILGWGLRFLQYHKWIEYKKIFYIISSASLTMESWWVTEHVLIATWIVLHIPY